MTHSSKLIYAQSSDIKSRTYLEYRHDMKKKGIRELEVRPYLEKLLVSKRKDKTIKVSKAGGDKSHWFSRGGRNISGEADYLATGKAFCLKYEFQYADAVVDKFDFKESKVGSKKGGKPRTPHKDREIFYIIGDVKKYGFLKPAWIMRNGKIGPVSAWGNRSAYRVDKTKFLAKCQSGGNMLGAVLQSVEDKIRILEFQKKFLDMESDRFSKNLSAVIDQETLFKIIPRTLEGFYSVCFLMSKMDKAPENPGCWLVYLASFLDKEMSSADLAKFMFSFDFVYFKSEGFQDNEKRVIAEAITEVTAFVKKLEKPDGLYKIGRDIAESDGLRHILFSINLLEDIRQDARVNFGIPVAEVKSIFETVGNPTKIAKILS